MRKLIPVLLGFPAFYFLVLCPMKADLIATLANGTMLDRISRINLFLKAANETYRNPDIFDLIGDEGIAAGRLDVAIQAYNQSISYAPERAATWFKIGAAKHLAHQDGAAEMIHALLLEPNNPLFLDTLKQLTSSQPQ